MLRPKESAFSENLAIKSNTIKRHHICISYTSNKKAKQRNHPSYSFGKWKTEDFLLIKPHSVTHSSQSYSTKKVSDRTSANLNNLRQHNIIVVAFLSSNICQKLL